MIEKLSPDYVDALKELINIGVGKAAGLLNDMLNAHVQLEVPQLRVLTPDSILDDPDLFPDLSTSAVKMFFEGAFSGSAALVFPTESALALVNLLVDDAENTDFDSLRSGTLTEVGNIIINGVMGSISNVLKQRFHYSLPAYVEDQVRNVLGLDGLPKDTAIILARTYFTVTSKEISGNIFLIFETGSFQALLDAILATDNF